MHWMAALQPVVFQNNDSEKAMKFLSKFRLQGEKRAER